MSGVVFPREELDILALRMLVVRRLYGVGEIQASTFVEPSCGTRLTPPKIINVPAHEGNSNSQ